MQERKINRSRSKMAFMETKKTKDWKSSKNETTKTQNKIKARTNFPYEMGHGDSSLPFHTCVDECLFHTSNVHISPNLVRQIFFFQSKKIRSQMVKNQHWLIATN